MQVYMRIRCVSHVDKISTGWLLLLSSAVTAVRDAVSADYWHVLCLGGV